MLPSEPRDGQRILVGARQKASCETAWQIVMPAKMQSDPLRTQEARRLRRKF